MGLGKRPRNLPSGSNSNLFMDIIREQALPLLPAKSLFRFLAVCRDWKLNISAPSFHHNQSLSCRGISGLFCQDSDNCIVFIPFHPISSGVPDPSLSFLPEPVDIRASSNGLLCCQGRNENRYYYLYNPVTKEWKTLPKPTARHGSEAALVLIFEPSLLNSVPEYKLICAFRSADFDDATEFDIYTSKNNTWNVSGELCFGARKAALGSGVHVNGVVYWPVVSGGVLSFDLTKDRSQLLDSNYSEATDCLLGTFDGRLYKVYNHDDYVLVRVLVDIHRNTMPLDDIDIWETIHVVYHEHTDIPFDEEDFDSKVVAVRRDILVVDCGNTLYSYDFENKETIPLSEPAEPYYKICVPYVNSLVSL
nr:F-box protein At5g03970-like [Ipomoea trifida]